MRLFTAILFLLSILSIPSFIHSEHEVSPESTDTSQEMEEELTLPPHLEPLWNSKNCNDGVVKDALCCSDNHCESAASKRACEMDKTCVWKVAKATSPNTNELNSTTLKNGERNKKGTCIQNRDTDNNVCCDTHGKKEGEGGEVGNEKDKSVDVCQDILKGRCPLSFQVPENCCNQTALKYNSILIVDKPGMVCCNSPCTQLKDHNCTLTPSCQSREKTESDSSPTARFMYGLGFGSGGVYPTQRQSYYPAHFNYGFNPHYLGVNHPWYNGGGASASSAHYNVRSDVQSTSGSVIDENDDILGEKEGVPPLPKSVHEVTVDDVMRTLVDALDNDNDVFEQKLDLYGDPVFGQQQFGLIGDEYTYEDPDAYLKLLYPDMKEEDLAEKMSPWTPPVPTYHDLHRMASSQYTPYGHGGYMPYQPSRSDYYYNYNIGYETQRRGPDYVPYDGNDHSNPSQNQYSADSYNVRRGQEKEYNSYQHQRVDDTSYY